MNPKLCKCGNEMVQHPYGPKDTGLICYKCGLTCGMITLSTPVEDDVLEIKDGKKVGMGIPNPDIRENPKGRREMKCKICGKFLQGKNRKYDLCSKHSMDFGAWLWKKRQRWLKDGR